MKYYLITEHDMKLFTLLCDPLKRLGRVPRTIQEILDFNKKITYCKIYLDGKEIVCRKSELVDD